MKTTIILLTAALTITFCDPQISLAQVLSSYGRETNGLFGPRIVGQPSVGYQTSGMFGPRTIGQATGPQPRSFALNAQSGQSGYYGSSVQPFASPIAVLPQSYTLTNNELEFPAVQESTSAFLPDANSAEAINTTQLTPDMMPAAATPSIVNPRVRIRAGLASNNQPQPYSLSTKLSNRLTTIARSNGMLSSESINVYVSKDIARLQGTVRTNANRVLLANVLGLEPGINQIDNRLDVK
jgi:hypothetical protein